MNRIAALMLLPCLFSACSRSESLGNEGKKAVLRIVVDPSLTRSSFIQDETKVNDLNIWVYTPYGLLREHHYLQTSFSGYASVSIDTRGGSDSRVVVLANAGTAVEAALSVDSRLTISHSTGTSDGVLMIGQTIGVSGQLSLKRVMARLSIGLNLSQDLIDNGAVLGSNVHLRSLRLCNACSSLSFVPSSAFATARLNSAQDKSSLNDGDYLSDEDIAALEAGSKVYLYALPNYTDADVSDVPEAGTELSTFIEMVLEYDSFGESGQGKAYHRFYVNDGDRIGVKGGCSYGLDVCIGADMAVPLWRKDDYRFFRQNEIVLGTVRNVDLLQEKEEGDYWFSLAPDSMIDYDGVFSIEPNLSGGKILGVTAESQSLGTSTIYIFNENPDSGGQPLGSEQISSILPEISVASLSADVTGEKAYLSISGRPAVSACSSEAIWEQYYGLKDIDFGDNGLFLYASEADGYVYVGDISEYGSKVGNSYGATVTFKGGFSVPLNVTLTDKYVACLAQNDAASYYNISSIDKPNSTYSAYSSKNFSAKLSAAQPSCLSSLSKSQMASAGWKSWIEGPDSYYEEADSRITTKTASSIVWNFTYSDFTSSKDGSYLLKMGKLNPWCGEYVEAQVSELDVVRLQPVGLKMKVDKSGDFWTFSFTPTAKTQGLSPVIDADASYKEKRSDVLNEIGSATGLSSGWKKSGNLYQVAFKVDTLDMDDVAYYFYQNRNSTSSRFSMSDYESLQYPRSAPYKSIGRYYSVSPYTGFMIDIFSPYYFGTGSSARYNTNSPSLVRKEDCSTEAYFPWTEP